ncbi:MAG: DNA polymerase III subunit gamma/tau [Planctomycetes bacterium]|nr:DNA polymerase III subunit gamma/tau [Planctomycetota bacterium]
MAETYTVLARKYRPRRFADLIGQPHVVDALRNAMATGRVAQAFLLTGSRGTGKTTSARLIASALNCPNRGKDHEPCGECESCRDIARGEDLDVMEMDAASNSRVDDIRQRLESVDTRPARGAFRIFIIDEVHMLSTSAFNALLKTLEEPPPHVKFILATTNPEKIPETILSRVQRYDFRRVTATELVARLAMICNAEKIHADEPVLRAVAEMAEGGVRDALGRLDQLVAFAGDKPTLEHAEKVFGLVSRPRLVELLQALAQGDARHGLLFAEEVFDSGKDVAEVLGSLVSLTRLLMLLAASGGDGKGLDLPADEVPQMHKVADRFGLQGLVYLAELLSDCRQRVRRAAFPRVVVESTLVKLSMVGRLETLEVLLSRLNEASADSGGDISPVSQESDSEVKRQSLNSAPKAPVTPAADGGGKAGITSDGARTPTEVERAAVEAVRRKFGAK